MPTFLGGQQKKLTTTTIMNLALDKQEEISARVSAFLGKMHQKFGTSKTLHDLGANDEMASNIHDFFSNPLQGLIDSNTASRKGIKTLVISLFSRFLSSHKNEINKVFLVDSDSSLVYYLNLKNQSFDSRIPFFDFLDFYDNLGLSDKMPLYLKFVPDRVVDKIELEELIIK